MIDHPDRAATRRIVRQVLAAECACRTSAFDEDGLLVTAFEERVGRRRYPAPSHPLGIVTMGRGVVATCHRDWVNPLRGMLEGRSRDEIFAAAMTSQLARFVAGEDHRLHGLTIGYVCAHQSFRPVADPAGVDFHVVEGTGVTELYRHPGFDNALSYDPGHPRPDVAVAVARRAGNIVGIAGMSADGDTMWQIGIDVVAGARSAGIGRALVGRLTTLAFRRGRVPFYAADVANVHSHGLAVGLGYWPAWVGLVAKGPAPA